MFREMELCSHILNGHIFSNYFYICHSKINNSLLYTVALALKDRPSFTVISCKILGGRSKQVQLSKFTYGVEHFYSFLLQGIVSFGKPSVLHGPSARCTSAVLPYGSGHAKECIHALPT